MNWRVTGQLIGYCLEGFEWRNTNDTVMPRPTDTQADSGQKPHENRSCRRKEEQRALCRAGETVILVSGEAEAEAEIKGDVVRMKS